MPHALAQVRRSLKEFLNLPECQKRSSYDFSGLVGQNDADIVDGFASSAQDKLLGLMARAHYLLWMCDQVESWSTDSAKRSTKASRWIAYMQAMMEAHFDQPNKLAREATREDVRLNLDLPHKPLVLGIDFGYTISYPNKQGDKKLFIHEDPNFLTREFVTGAEEVIPKLVDLFGPNRVYIISKCAEISEPRIMEWLDSKSFWSLTGMKRGNVHFCRERKDKDGICLKLGITHMVDDRLEVLHNLHSVTWRFALNPRLDDKDETPFIDLGVELDPTKRYSQAPIQVVASWSGVYDQVLQSLDWVPSLSTK